MTTSEPRHAFVWIWLPDATEPVVAGRIDQAGPRFTFTYGRSYLGREGAIPIYLPELPLERGRHDPAPATIAGCLADAGPDAWGQRVILNRLLGAEDGELDVLTNLLESGSDRIGALDFQLSGTDYVPRLANVAPLEELISSAERVEAGIPLTPALDQALLHGSSVGGARPKVLLADGDRRVIAKFASSTDTFPVVKGEFVAMELARRVGLDVAPVEITTAQGKDVLLVERFDRTERGTRRAMVSALTILGLDEISARYATYPDLALAIRERFTDPDQTLRELFARIIFNILISNSDDHARNHAAFWDGDALTLTPAYDLCPQLRDGGEATQVMAIGRDGWRFSQVAGCIERAAVYHLSEQQALEIVTHQIQVIQDNWGEVCDLAELSEVDRQRFWRRQFLNPYALEGFTAAAL